MSIRLTLGLTLALGTTANAQFWNEAMEAKMRRLRVAQFQPGQPTGGGAIVLADRRVVRNLDKAAELLEAKDYANAVTLLQGVLDFGEDAFFHPEDQPKSLYRSVKSEATRLIGSIPAKDRKGTYELEFGATAGALLDEARRDNDAAKLAEIARRYLHTEAGYEAQYRLGVWHFDQGRLLAAAICFDRLGEIPEAAARFEPTLSLRHHAALVATGEEESARELVASLKERFAGRKIELAGRTLDLAEGDSALALLRDRFLDPARDAAIADDWTTVRGGPRRTGLVAIVPDPRAKTWSVPTIVDPFRENPTDISPTDLTKKLDSTVNQLATALAARNPLPSSQPIVVGNRLVTRTIANVRVLDLDSGDVTVETYPESALEDLVGFDGEAAVNPQMLNNFVTQRTWGDANQGTFSSDGHRVYVVEDTGSAQPSRDPMTGQFQLPSRESRLVAYDIETGKIDWQVGGPTGDFASPMAGTFFLGAPLPLAGQLFAIAEVENEVRLIVLAPHVEKGREKVEVAWSQPLAAPNVDLTRDIARRVTGLAVTYADGVLVCPTGTGIYVAIDVSNRTLLWARKFEPTGGQPPPFPVPNPNPGQTVGWKDDIVIAANGQLLLTPKSTNELYCVDLRTGRDVWKKPVKRADGLYVAGIANGAAIVVGAKQVQSINLEDGQPTWKKPLALAAPAGRGFLLATHAVLPLSSNEIAFVDLRAGKITTKVEAPKGVELGNLVPAGDRVVSQGTKTVDVLPLELPAAEMAGR